MQGTVHSVWQTAAALNCLTLQHSACWGPSREVHPSSCDEQTVHEQRVVAR